MIILYFPYAYLLSLWPLKYDIYLIKTIQIKKFLFPIDWGLLRDRSNVGRRIMQCCQSHYVHTAKEQSNFYNQDGIW